MLHTDWQSHNNGVFASVGRRIVVAADGCLIETYALIQRDGGNVGCSHLQPQRDDAEFFVVPTTSSPLKNLVLDIDYNDAVVVIHTSPGAAQLIARLLDSLGKAEGILGSIAGDDTIFTTPARGFTVKDLHDAILVLFEQEL